MQKSASHILPELFLFFLCLLLLSNLFSLLAQENSPFPPQSENTQSNAPSYPIYVLDPGHGGEDAGTVAKSGALEKDLNLQMALLVADALRACGRQVLLTREEDILLYDPTSDYIGHKKEQDLATRLRFAEQTPNAVFVSIHMNAYPKTQYSGLQVWYSPNHPASALYAQGVQSAVREQLQPQNKRQTKEAGSSIYLLHHLECPAILIECGFLSNPAEAKALCDPSYQEQLARLIALSLIETEGKQQ
ncbi:MAG: N-acetylmuramoyl-L-alanine amidase [Clostridia bacterium]|nr:N-acetylmuramoyl-L-alanine amidase [Clostridia bacterium]